MVRKALVMLFLPFLFGCAHQKQIDPNYLAYLNAITKQQQMKIVEIEAQPGQDIVLKGVSKFVVYAPSGSGSKVNIQPYRPAPHPIAQVAKVLANPTENILLTYFRWKFGADVLKRALDRAGDTYGTYIGGDNVGADKVGGDKYVAGVDVVTGTKYDITGDYVGADKTGNDKVGGDNIGGDNVSGSNYEGDYTGGDNVGGDDYDGGGNTNNYYESNATTP